MSYAIDRNLRSYQALPAISGASFLPVSFLGRLPTTMAPLAVLTFTAAGTGSFAAAGLAATAVAAGTAVGASSMGVLADRFGQRPVLSAAVAVNAVALTVLALLPSVVHSRPLLLSLCALIGLSLPQVGGMARARWLALTRRHAGTAMAYEGTADEVAFVVGPALTGLLAAGWGSASALLVAAAAGALGAGAFALHPTHAVTRGHSRTQDGAAPRTGLFRLLRLVLAPLLAMLLMGAFFSSVATALTAYATINGHPAAAGLVYALMAVGSAVTALGSTALPERIGPAIRCLVCAGGLLLGVALLTLAASISIGWLCLAMLLTGLPVGPMLVTLNQVVGARVPTNRSATAMSFMSAGSVIGGAAGATGAGALADLVGWPGPFGVAAVACLLLLLLTSAGLRTRRAEVR